MRTTLEIAQMVKDFRKKWNLSRESFAEDADISTGTLQSIEQNRRGCYPSMVVAVKLADAMGITLDELVRGD